MSKFEWQGKTIELAPLTPAIKGQYCDWIKRKMLADAPGLLNGQEAQTLRHALMAGGVVFWAKNPSASVAASLMSPEGLGHLVTLLLGGQIAKWPASEVEDLLSEVGANGPLDVALSEVLDEKKTPANEPAPQADESQPA
jgi:hypothetical protein